MIELGDEAIDTITGFKGTVVAITKWISGCDRINLQPRVKKDGTVPDSMSFDETQLKIVKKKKIKESGHSKGGPRPSMFQQPIIKK